MSHCLLHVHFFLRPSSPFPHPYTSNIHSSIERMSGRILEQGLPRTPSRPLVISSPFLLARFVVFSLLVYLSLTALGFAAWNVGASRAAGANVAGASIFLIFNGIAMCLFVTMALTNIRFLSFSTSQVTFECVWTGIFTVLQIAASIDVTLSGPPTFCDARAPLSICASITILVPISWLAATLLLGYFVAVLALCVSHLRVHLDLWSTPIYEVAWFDDGKNKHSSAPQLPPLDTSPIHLTITPPLLQDQNESAVVVENQPSRTEPDSEPEPVREQRLPSNPNVWWDSITPGRAGRDHPFTIRRPRERPPSHRSSSLRRTSSSSARRNDWDRPRVAPATLPYYQPQYGRVWQQPPQPLPQLNEEEESFDVSPHYTIDPDPSDVVLNENEPIPVGDRSHWVRAAQSPGPYVPPRPPRRSQYG